MTAELLGDILGHHELVQVIGGGPGGLVYEAFDPRLGRHVAIRTFRLDALDPPQAAAFEARLRANTAAAAALEHPNIVAVYDCDRQGQTASLAMEFVEGENLAQHLARVGKLPPLQALALMAQLLSALEAAHAHGLAHGRIEPEHLLVSRTGRLKVLGFGVPQQEADPDAAGDLFRAAAVAWQLFTGELPPQPPGQAGQRLAPHQLRPDLPVALDGVFDRALSDDPQARYGSAAELSAALRAAFEPALWERPGKVATPSPRKVATTSHVDEPSEPAPVHVAPAAAARRPEAVRSQPPVRRGRTGVAVAIASLIGVLVVAGLFLSGESGPPDGTVASTPDATVVRQPSSPPASTSEPITPPVTEPVTEPVRAPVATTPPPQVATTRPAAPPAPSSAPSRTQGPTAAAAAAAPAQAPVVAAAPTPAPAAAAAPDPVPATAQARTVQRAPAPTTAPENPAPLRVETQAPPPPARSAGEDLGTAGAGPVTRPGPAVSGAVAGSTAAGGVAPGGATGGTAVAVTPAIVAGAGAPDNRSTTAPETAMAARQSPMRDARQQPRGDPEDACRHQQLLIAREVCNVAQCEDPQWRSHPTCVRRHAEQRMRDQQREQASRTR